MSHITNSQWATSFLENTSHFYISYLVCIKAWATPIHQPHLSSSACVSHTYWLTDWLTDWLSDGWRPIQNTNRRPCLTGTSVSTFLSSSDRVTFITLSNPLSSQKYDFFWNRNMWHCRPCQHSSCMNDHRRNSLPVINNLTGFRWCDTLHYKCYHRMPPCLFSPCLGFAAAQAVAHSSSSNSEMLIFLSVHYF